MQIMDAQADLRRAYTDGGPGVVISGLVWLVAAYVESTSGVATGFAVLFFGGMLIFPLALSINRGLLRRAAETKGNPGGPLVLESTITMIAGLVAAWLFVDFKPEWVMPLAAIMVGTHYFAFRTAYGMNDFYALAAIVTLIGAAGIFLFAPVPMDVAWCVGTVEVVSGLFMTIRALRRA